MPQQTAPTSLAPLDVPQLAGLDDRVWSANLHSLRTTQPALASHLSSQEVASGWMSVVALDGCASWARSTDQGWGWLGATAAPMRRALGTVGGQQPTGHNFLLPEWGAGREAEALLTRLPADAAVFVGVSSLADLMPALRIIDFAGALDAGRLWFLPPGEESIELARLMVTHPGLLPPASMPQLSWVMSERLEEWIGIISREQSTTHTRRAQELAAAHAQLRQPVAATDALAVLAPREDAVARPVARKLAQAASEAGERVICPAGHEVPGPLNAQPLKLATELAQARPHRVACVGLDPSGFVFPSNACVVEWQVRAPVPELPPAALFTRRDLEAKHDPDETGPPHAAPEVLLLCDAALDAGTPSVKLHPTHAQLWSAAREIFAEQAGSKLLDPHALLMQAARRLALPVSESIRAVLHPLLESQLVPGLTATLFSAAAARRGLPCRCAPTDLNNVSSLPPTSDGVAVLLCGDPAALPFLALSLAALGWQLAVPGWRPDGCGTSLLKPPADYAVLASVSQFNQLLRSPAPQRTAAARHTMINVRSNHLMSHRWGTLATRPQRRQ